MKKIIKTEHSSVINMFTVISSSKFFRENSELLMESERALYLLGIIVFQNFCFSIVFDIVVCTFLPTSIQN